MEALIGIIGLIVFIGLIACISNHLKRKKKLQNNLKENNASLSCPLLYLEGIPYLTPNIMCTVLATENKLIFKANTQNFELNYSQITNLQQITNMEIVQKNKSSIKRGVVGGLAFGPAGLLLGGLSGIGTKDTKQLKNYLVINYKSSSSDEINVLNFQSLNYNNCNKIITFVNSKITKDEQNIKL